MSTREERERGIPETGEMNGVRLAEHLGVAHGTVKRWLRDGLPCRHEGKKVWADPVAAEAWVAERFKGRRTIAFNRVSFVYAAQRESDGAVKVGWSSDVMRRVQEMRRYCKSAVQLVLCLPGNKGDELRIHDALAPARLAGEWYVATPDEVIAVMLQKRAA
jgi:hypothetical protein